MACFRPVHVRFYVDAEGKKRIVWRSKLADWDWDTFYLEDMHPEKGIHDQLDVMKLPCSGCIGCRLEHSRQWAVRAYHEASVHEDNCFVTLTVNPDYLYRLFPKGSLSKEPITKFLHRLRSKLRRGVKYLDFAYEEREYSRDNIRFFYAGSVS